MTTDTNNLSAVAPEVAAQADYVRGKMAELEQALETNLPGFAHILKDIHSTLQADPEVVTILQPEEIAVVVRGLEKHAAIIVTPAKAKKASKSKTPISASDL